MWPSKKPVEQRWAGFDGHVTGFRLGRLADECDLPIAAAIADALTESRPWTFWTPPPGNPSPTRCPPPVSCGPRPGATPRQLFVPRILGGPAALGAGDPGRLDAVYADEALATQTRPAGDGASGREIASSSGHAATTFDALNQPDATRLGVTALNIPGE